MAEFILREATFADSEALKFLEQECPQGTTLQILSERNDYFFRSRLYGNHHTLVAVHDSRIIGVLAAVKKELIVQGRKFLGIFLYDLRIHPKYRKTLGARIMVRAWNNVEMWAKEHNAHFIYGYVKGDNLIMRGFFNRKGYSVVANMIVVSRAVFRNRKVSVVPRKVGSSNSDLFKDFLAEYGSKNLLPAVFRNGYLSEEMKKTGLYTCYRVSRNGSSASAGFLRLSEAIRTKVIRIPLYYRAARMIFKPLSVLFPLPRIPVKGGILKYYHAFNHTASGPEGMRLWREIMKHFNNIALEDGCQLLTTAFDKYDRFRPEYRKGSISTIRYVVGFKALQPDLPEDFSPFYPDIRDMD